MKKTIKILFIVFIIISILIFSIKMFSIDKRILKILYPNNYSSYVEEYSKLYGVDKYIIFAIIKNESNFNQIIASNKGARGLMQLMEATANEVAEKIGLEKIDIIDPETNIKLGTKYFSILYKKYNNTELALAAYNAGSGNVDKWIEKGIISEDAKNIENIPYKETNMYVRKVIQSKQIYEFLYEQ